MNFGRRDDWPYSRSYRDMPRHFDFTQPVNHPAPPCVNLPHREFSRFDYSHDRQPSWVPHVREYEHGIQNFRGIPVFNPHIPPPTVYNSVSNNPSLFDNFRRQTDAGLSLNQSSLNDIVRDTYSNNLPCADVQLQGPGNSARPRAGSAHPLRSQDSDLIDQLQKELSETRATLQEVLEKGEAVRTGGALPSLDILPEDAQEADRESADEGKS